VFKMCPMKIKQFVFILRIIIMRRQVL